MIGGCSPPDQRTIEVAQESMKRQAKQNETLAEQSRATTEAAGNLVKEQSAARKELTQVQQKIIERDAQGRQDLNQLERDVHKTTSDAQDRVDQERSKLETERRQIAQERQQAPIIAEAIRDVGLLVVCVLPLAVAIYLLHVLKSTPAHDDAMTEILIQELIADGPIALNYREPARLESRDRDVPRIASTETDPPDCSSEDSV